MNGRRLTVISCCESLRGYGMYNKSYEKKSLRLVHSLRTNGGKYKDSHVVMWYSKEAPPSEETKMALSNLGCTLVEGETLIPEDPVANKIEACCIPVGSEYALWMDSDMYILDTHKFESLVELEVDVAAVGAEFDHHRWARKSDDALWSELYTLAGVAAPDIRIPGGIDGRDCNFYFNSALVLQRTGRGFADVWKDLAKRVRFSGILHSEHNFTQTSLTLAMLKTNSVWKHLPAEYNAYWSVWKEEALDLAILHYQDNKITDSRVLWDV